ncbi:hypothetical protein ZWY2020_012567 [Hordeum vulgare]|nr:hypothetical protein ZWY2020_012567 [Hordeum vulgare]
MLPRSVEKLSNLLTLDLLRSDVHELPSGIVNLKKLRHLFVEKRVNADLRGIKCFSGVHVPNGLGNLTNLQTLQALVAHDESIRHLRELRQLRSLRLLDVKRIYCGRIVESLVQMQCLSHLDVNASDEDEFKGHSGGILSEIDLPYWLGNVYARRGHRLEERCFADQGKGKI